MKAIYAGSFDPITQGHMDVISKACKTFPEVVVVVADSSAKKYMFSSDERVAMIEQIYRKDNSHVSCVKLPKGKYVADFANELKATHIVRGLRNATDLLYEQDMYDGNKRIARNLESVFFMPSKEVEHISSSSVKSFLGFSGYSYMIDSMVHPVVKNKLSLYTLSGVLNKWKDHFNLSDELVRRYSEPNRLYHNLSHVTEMLLELENMDREMYLFGSGFNVRDGKYSFLEKLAVLAILYHDVIYSPANKSNESNSIDFFLNEQKQVSETSMYDGLIQKAVAKIIDSTRVDWDRNDVILIGNEFFRGLSTNQVDFDFHLRYLIKIVRTLDWRVFCLPPDRYDIYCANIRKEVESFGLSNFQLGRKKFLEAVDLSKYIDFSLLPYGSYENASKNIRREKEALKEK